jgi:hypothetical protein
MNRPRLLWTLILTFCALSCSDQGQHPVYLEITSLSPAPNASRVDKGTYIVIEFNSPVHHAEFDKIRLRYVDDTASIPNYVGCGLTPPETPTACVGPFIWKPGRTVEVTIPKTITDILGRRLKSDYVYRFTIARDTVPFRVVDSFPRQGDTLSLSSRSFWDGFVVFSDYYALPQGLPVTITPPAEVYPLYLAICDTRGVPTRTMLFGIRNMQPHAYYELRVAREVRDYEGEILEQDYRIGFYTKP